MIFHYATDSAICAFIVFLSIFSNLAIDLNDTPFSLISSANIYRFFYYWSWQLDRTPIDRERANVIL